MITALDNLQCRVGHAVDQPMLTVDAARPIARKIAFQRFGFAGAFKRMTQAFFDQGVDFAKRDFVSFLPVLKLLPSGWLENKVHSFAIASSSAMVLITILAGSVSAIATKRAALFSGEDSK